MLAKCLIKSCDVHAPNVSHVPPRTKIQLIKVHIVNENKLYTKVNIYVDATHRLPYHEHHVGTRLVVKYFFMSTSMSTDKCTRVRVALEYELYLRCFFMSTSRRRSTKTLVVLFCLNTLSIRIIINGITCSIIIYRNVFLNYSRLDTLSSASVFLSFPLLECEKDLGINDRRLNIIKGSFHVKKSTKNFR